MWSQGHNPAMQPSVGQFGQPGTVQQVVGIVGVGQQGRQVTQFGRPLPKIGGPGVGVAVGLTGPPRTGRMSCTVPSIHPHQLDLVSIGSIYPQPAGTTPTAGCNLCSGVVAGEIYHCKVCPPMPGFDVCNDCLERGLQQQQATRPVTQVVQPVVQPIVQPIVQPVIVQPVVQPVAQQPLGYGPGYGPPMTAAPQVVGIPIFIVVVDQLRQMFDAADTTRVGQIDAPALHGIFQRAGHAVTLELCKLMINMFDQDCNFHITFEQFRQLMEYLAAMQRAFQAVDTNRSWRLERAEVVRAIEQSGFRLSPETFNILFRKADRQRMNSLAFYDFVELSLFIGSARNVFAPRDVQQTGVISLSFDQFLLISRLAFV